jgi:uncharacterized protein YkwD
MPERGSTSARLPSIPPGMGIDDRDWNREPAEAPRPRSHLTWMLLATLVAVLAVLVGLRARSEAQPSSISGEHQVRMHDTKISLLPGLPPITLHKGSLYPKDDPWQSYLADERTCPGGERTDLPLDRQASVMACLVNFARRSRHLAPLTASPLLTSSSLAKANRILRCVDFSHSACGEDPAAEVRAAGFRGAWGENLYIAEGALGAPRVALDGWLNSNEHRENLFQPAWRSEGIAVVKLGRFRDYTDVTLWVNQFGDG